MDQFTPPPTPEVFTGNELVARLIDLKEEKIALNNTIKELEIKNKKLEEHNAILIGAIKNITSMGKDILNDYSDGMTDNTRESGSELNQQGGMNLMANDHGNSTVKFMANDKPTQLEETNFMANDNITQLGDVNMNFMAQD